MDKRHKPMSRDDLKAWKVHHMYYSYRHPYSADAGHCFNEGEIEFTPSADGSLAGKIHYPADGYTEVFETEEDSHLYIFEGLLRRGSGAEYLYLARRSNPK